jgi:hypothetical protein
MVKLSFSDGLAIAGLILAIVLVVLDKAGKLKGPMLLALLAVAACMAIPLLFSIPWVAEAPRGLPLMTRQLLMLFFLGGVWASISVWITTSDLPTLLPKPEVERGDLGTDYAKPVERHTPAIPTKEVRPKKPPTPPVAKDEKPPTLRDLFAKDFPNTMKVTDADAFTVQWRDTDKVLHVTSQLYLDFPAKTKYIGFYIPSSDPLNEQARTAVACVKLAEMDAPQQILSGISKKVGITSGSIEHMNNIEELTFSGRVFIYHEDFLSIPQKAAVLQAFSVKHYDVTFIGTDHLGNALTAWYQEHKAK